MMTGLQTKENMLKLFKVRSNKLAPDQLTNELIISDWQTKEILRQNRLRGGYLESNRTKIVFWGKIAFSAFVLLLWIGHRETTLSDFNTRRSNESLQIAIYKNLLSKNSISKIEANKETREVQKKHDLNRGQLTSFDLFFYNDLALSILSVWIWIGQRAKSFFNNWIHSDKVSLRTDGN